MRKIVVELGRTRTDMRLSLFIAKPPGFGGGAIKNSILRILKGVAKVSVPTTRHPERLVGKIVPVIVGKGRIELRKNYGYCKDPFVIFDEALPLILGHDDRHQEFWSYLNTALDTYGENLIEKKSVNDLEPLSYLAELSAIFIFQLSRIPNSFISRGVFRRGLPVVIEVPKQERKEIIRRRLQEQRPSESGLEELQAYLRALASLQSITCLYVGPVAEAIETATEEFLEAAESSQSETVRQYGSIMHSTFPDLLLKMSVSLAVDDAVFGKTVYDPPVAVFDESPPSGPTISSHPEIPVTTEHVEVAKRHLLVFLDSAFDFIDRFVSEHNMPPGVSHRILLCLKILKGCGDENSSTMSISEFQQEISNILKCSESTARSIYTKMKHMGLIDSKQVGSHDSRVWLTSEGLRLLASEET